MELVDRWNISASFSVTSSGSRNHNKLLPALKLPEITGSLLHVFVWPTTLMTYVSPQVSWSNVQLELLELQVMIVPLLSTADTSWV